MTDFKHLQKGNENIFRDYKKEKKVKKNKKKIARYYSDKSTLNKPEVKNSLPKTKEGYFKKNLDEESFNMLNVLPKNYYRWVKKQNKKLKKELEKEKEEEVFDNFKELQRQVFLDISTRQIGKATEKIVNEIKRKNFIYTTRDDIKSEMWIYKEGIYIPQGKTFIKEFSRKILDKAYTPQLSNKIISKIEADTFINYEDLFKEDSKQEIPLMNGILNIFTRELKEFTPKKIFFNKLPVEYNPSAECPKIDKFLRDVLKSSDDKKVFYEILGFSLLKDYKFEKSFMFIGDGRNGKDKCLELIKRMIGINNCCSVPLSSLKPDSFIISEFFKKMVNIAGEIERGELKKTSTFKELTGRSVVSAPRKFLNAITFVNYAKFIFACNELPMVFDNSRGFWDRWVLLEFPYTFVPKSEFDKAEEKTFLKIRDENIIEKITTPEELSGLLNKALDGLNRLNNQKDFSTTFGSKEIKNLWMRKSNSFMAFCLDNLKEQYDGKISKKELKRTYSNYCRKYKLRGVSDIVIKITLQEMFGAVDERIEILGDRHWYWVGINWKEKLIGKGG